LQSTQQDDEHKYLFVGLFIPYGNWLQQRVLGQNLLCLCLDFCGPCLTWGLATLHVKGVTLHWNCQLLNPKYAIARSKVRLCFKCHIQTVCASMNIVQYKLTKNMKVVRSRITKNWNNAIKITAKYKQFLQNNYRLTWYP